MVNNLPIIIIGSSLLFAFLIAFFSVISKIISKILFYLIILFDAVSSIYVFVLFLMGKIQTPINVIIGGFPPPFGINLYVTSMEAGLASLLTTIAFFSSFIFLKNKFEGSKIKVMILYLLAMTGGIGMLFTGDMFNLFVFLEITSISLYGLIASKLSTASLESSFKYMILGSIASSLMLLGIIMIYRATGTLNIIDVSHKLVNSVPFIAGSLLLIFSLIFELEIFPINGWAMDVYQSAHPSISALIAGAISKIFLLVFMKIAHYLQFPYILEVSLIAGLTTYLVSHFFAWRQKNFRRMLGYSSAGELGLMIVIAGFIVSGKLVGTNLIFASLALIMMILNHSFSKISLFSASKVIGEKIEEWKGKTNKGGILNFITGIPVLSLIGMPPFAGFWAKLFFIFAVPKEFIVIPLIVLIAALAEIVYYIKFYMKASVSPETKTERKNFITMLTPVLFSSLILILSAFAGYVFFKETALNVDSKILLLLLVALLIYLLKDAKILQWILSIILTGGATYIFLMNSHSTFTTLFLLMFLPGSIIMLISTYPVSEKTGGSFYPFISFLIISMGLLVFSKSFLFFFIVWELISWWSFLLIFIRSKKASFKYLILSSIGGFSMLYGIYLMGLGYSLLPYILIAIGFLVKLAVMPFHIWAGDGYTESPDEFTPIFSGVVSKVGLFGFVFMTVYGMIPNMKVNYIIALLGAITAFFGTLYAIFQDDIKKLLAYSSIGQLGYLVIGLALYTPLGMLSAVYHGINHLLFKGVLFISAMGIIYRTKKTNLSEMGGLIKKMPFTFIAVLMAIIALSGIPPLSGFGAKWLLYTALLEKGWLIILIISMAASILAFLYCFKILHAVFLGQLRDELRETKEVPWTMIISESILLGFIMLISVKASIIIEPIKKMVTEISGKPSIYLKQNLIYISKFGYWGSYFMMVFVGGMFVIALIVLSFALLKRIRKVKQLDVGYSGEVPQKPEHLHFGYGMYAHFRRAVKHLLYPLVEKVYSWIYNTISEIVEYVRRIYTGDLNTYVIYFILILVIALSIMSGVKLW